VGSVVTLADKLAWFRRWKTGLLQCRIRSRNERGLPAAAVPIIVTDKKTRAW
jgi:hypothetical protein